MANPQLKSVRSPDDVFRAEKILERSVQIGEQTIGRATIQPGWRWSIDLKPTAGTPWCTFRHLGIALSGRFHVRMENGHEIDIGPDDVFDIPPGHDAWVVGDEPLETVEIAGIFGFGRQAPGETYITSVLITDVVDSTAMVERLGEPEWRRVQTAHYEQVRRVLDRHRGVEVTTTGDGVIATFDSAARVSGCVTSRMMALNAGCAATNSNAASPDDATSTTCRSDTATGPGVRRVPDHPRPPAGASG